MTRQYAMYDHDGVLMFASKRELWDWLKAENRHLSAKPEPEIDDKGKPVRWFPRNRAALRDVRHGRGNPDAQLGRSRRQRVSRGQHRADVRDNDRKWRQEKRRERRARAAAEIEAAAAAEPVPAQPSPWVVLADPSGNNLTSVPA